MSRSAEQICVQWLKSLLPPGDAWQRSEQGNIAGLLRPAAVLTAELEAFIAALALEISPEHSTLLLTDYEAVLGNDLCARDGGDLTIEQRQALAFSRWVAAGGQSLAFYKSMAAAAGVEIEIDELDPFVCGGDDAVCGEAVCSTPADFDVVVITLPNRNTGLECPILRNVQPETTIVFEYAAGTEQGTLDNFTLNLNTLL